MAEHSGWAFLEQPIVRTRPQVRQFAVAKAGAHTGRGVVLGDGVTAEKGYQAAANKRLERASGFQGNKRKRVFGYLLQQCPQEGLIEMVEEQVGHHDGGYRSMAAL